jgi:hypothetical protein
VPAAVPISNEEPVGGLMKVTIGVDAHKATHQAVVVDDREAEIDRISVRATRNQTERLLAWSAPFVERV